MTGNAKTRGIRFIVVDDDMNHHLAASGSLGQVIRRNFPVAVANGLDREDGVRADMVDPLCAPLDTLARDVPLPEVDPGDLIGVFLSGAYTRSASPLGFLSHPAPAEVWIDGGMSALVRRRGRWEDFEADQEPAGEPAD